MSARVSSRLLAAQSDERLVELVREGHERAFEAVVQRYRRPLLRYCGRIGLSDARGEDAVQHALLQAWLALAGGAQVRELRPWLYRIAHNAAVNTIRSGSRDQGPLPDTESVSDDAAAAASSLEHSIAARDALTEVAALPQLQREAILLCAVDGRSHDEVASVLGVSHGAVRGLLYRARTTLRAAAAAITPQPLVSWASGCVGRTAPTAERIAVLCAPGSPAGMTGTLLKGGAMALTAAVFVAGAAVVPLKRHVNPRARHIASSAGTRGAPVRAFASPTAGGARTAVVSVSSAGSGALAGAGSGAARFADRTGTRSSAPAGGERAPAVPSAGPGPPPASVPALASPGATGRQGPASAAEPGSGAGGSQGHPEGGGVSGVSGVSTSPGGGGPAAGPTQPPGEGSGGGSGGSESGSPGKGPGSEGSGDGSGGGGEGSDNGLREGGGSSGSGGEATETESSVDHSGAAGGSAASAERGD